MKNLNYFVLWMCISACQNAKPGVVTVDLRNNPEGKGTPVATFGSDSVSADQATQLMMEMAPYERARFQEEKGRKEYIEGLARFEVLAMEAEKRGLAQSPEVILATKKALVQQLLSVELDQKPFPVSDADIQAYYDKRINDYVKPEAIRLSHIFFAAAKGAKERPAQLAKAQAVLAKAKALPPLDFSSFAQLVRENTDDSETKAIDGDMRFLSFPNLESKYGAALAAAAQNLRESGKVADALVETDAGFHILKLQGRQGALNLTLDQVKPQIQSALNQQKRMGAYRELIESLTQSYSMKVNDEAIRNMKIDASLPPNPRNRASLAPGFVPPPPPAETK